MEHRKKRHIMLRRDGRYQTRCIVGVTEQGRARYQDFYGKTREEVEAKLEAIGRKHHKILLTANADKAKHRPSWSVLFASYFR